MAKQNSDGCAVGGWCRYIRTRNYEDIAEALYGHWLAVVVKLFIILVNFGACISYLIIIGDLLTSSIGERIKGMRRCVVVRAW